MAQVNAPHALAPKSRRVNGGLHQTVDQEALTTVYIALRKPTVWTAANTDSSLCTENSTRNLDNASKGRHGPATARAGIREEPDPPNSFKLVQLMS